MVLGFAVVAVFAVAVFSTIVATVNEMKKPQAPNYGPTPMDIAAGEMPHPLSYRFSYQKVDPNVTYTRHSPYDERFEVNDDQEASPDYDSQSEDSRKQPATGSGGISAWGSQSQEYDYEEEEAEKEQNHPNPYYTAYQLQQFKMYQMQQLQHQQHLQQQQNPFGPPSFPSSGYGTAGVGYSSAGNGGNPSNKAFIPFFGYVDPVVLIAIVAFPVLCTLGVTSLLMPIIPIVIYIIGLIFPSSKKKMKTRLSSLRTNSRMRQVTSSTADHSNRVQQEAIERMFRVLSQALDKF